MILRLLDALLDVRDDLLGRVNQLLALPDLQHRCQSIPFSISDQVQRILARGQRALGDRQLRVQFEQVEVGACDVAHQSRDHGFAVFLGGEQVGPCGLRRVSQPAPNVGFEREEIERQAAEGAPLFEARRQRERSAHGIASRRDRARGANGRKLIGPCDSEIRARRIHPRHGVA